MQSQRLEQAEHRPQSFADGSGAIVAEDKFGGAVAQRQLRDRGVGLSSEDALIELGDEGGECLAFADGPRRGSSHDLLRELGESAPKEFLAVEKSADYAGGVAGQHSHHAKNRLLAEAMSAMNFPESHASPNALRPAINRWRDAPSAALTTISNIWSSPYFACALAMSSSVTL